MRRQYQGPLTKLTPFGSRLGHGRTGEPPGSAPNELPGPFRPSRRGGRNGLRGASAHHLRAFNSFPSKEGSFFITRIKSTSMFVQQEIAGKASAHPASGRRRGAFAGKARLLQPFSIDDAARTSSPDRARGAHAVTAPGDPVLVRRVCRRQEGLESALRDFLRTYARRGAATRIRAFHQGRARLGSGESPEAAPGWAPRLLSRLAASRGASIKPEPPRSKSMSQRYVSSRVLANQLRADRPDCESVL